MVIEREGADPTNGGFVAGVPPHMVGAAESIDCQNTDPADPMGMVTRAGSSAFGSAIGGPTLNSGQLTTGDLKMCPDIDIALVRGASVIYFANNTGGWGSVPLTFSGTPTLMNAGFLRALEPSTFFSSPTTPAFIVTNKSSPTFFNTTTGSVLAASMASAGTIVSEVVLHDGRLFAFMRLDGFYQNWVNHSALNDASDWTSAGNAGAFPIGDSTGFAGGESTRSGLYFFKRRSVYILTGTGPSDYEVDLVTDNLGCVSRWGHCTDGQGAYFASDDGIYYVNGMNVSRISDKVRQEYLDIPDKVRIAMGFRGEKLYVWRTTTGGTTANDAALVAAPRRRTETGEVQAFWSKWPSMAYGDSDTSKFDGDIYAVTVASSLQIYKLETGSGAGITLTYNTPDLDFGYPDVVKNLVRWTTHHKPNAAATQTWSYQWYANGASVGSAGTFTIGSIGTHDGINRAPKAEVVGEYLRLKLSCVGQVTLYGYEAYAEVEASEDFPRV